MYGKVFEVHPLNAEYSAKLPNARQPNPRSTRAPQRDDLIRYAGDEQRAKEGSEMKLLVEIAIIVILVAVRFFGKEDSPAQCLCRWYS